MTVKNTKTQTIVIAFLTFIGLGLSAGLLGVAWPYIQEDFNLALDAVNALLLVQAIAYTLASFIIGRLMARLGSGVSLIAGMLIMALCLFAFAAASTWALLIFLGLVAGFGSGIVDAGLNMYVTTYHSAREMNWLHASFGLGITIGPLVMTYCAENLTWQTGYAVAGGILLIILALLFLSRRLWRNEGFQSAENTPVRRASFSQSARLPVLWFSMIAFLAYVGVEIGIGQWAFTLLTQSREIAPEVAGVWVSIYWGVFTGGRIFFGFIANRFDPSRLLRWSLLGTVTGTLLLAWNPLPVIGSIGLIIAGFAEAPVFAMLMTTTPQRVGLEHAENGVSLQMVAVGIGSAILPGLIGTIGATFGLETMTTTFVVMAVITLVFLELANLARTRRPLVSIAAD
ncbi:MAG: MFS transporter [Anaerolineaceae bacterium]|nr:MFS transporter [Anaerolineaceae bacterium]